MKLKLLSGPDAFYLVIAAVLAPLGAWFAFGHSPSGRRTPPAPNDWRITALALVVGTIGGIYGIGGGWRLALAVIRGNPALLTPPG